MSVPFYAAHISDNEYLKWKEEEFGLCIPPRSPWHTVENVVMQMAEIAVKDMTDDERAFYFHPCVDTHFPGGFLSKDGLPEEQPALVVAACNKIFEDARFSNRCAVLALHVIGHVRNMEMNGGALHQLAARLQKLTRDDFVFGEAEKIESVKALAFTSAARLLRKVVPYTQAEEECFIALSVKAMELAPDSFGRSAADIFHEAVQKGYDPAPQRFVIEKMFAENKQAVIHDDSWKAYIRKHHALPDNASDNDIYMSFVRKRFPALAPLFPNV